MMLMFFLSEMIVDDIGLLLNLLLSRHVVCWSQRDESMRKIRDLGSLPSDAFEKYQGLGIKQVLLKFKYMFC